jgi:hypothetical protein
VARDSCGTSRDTPIGAGESTSSTAAEVRFDAVVQGTLPEKGREIRGGKMSEDYRIVGRFRGEPLPAGCVGVRVRVRLSGCPGRRWSHDLGARLVRELCGQAAVGHLRLNVNDLVLGDQIALDGVEASEATELAGVLQRAVDAANRASTDAPDQTGT